MRLYKIKRLLFVLLVSVKVLKEMFVMSINYFTRGNVSLLGKILEDVYVFSKEIPLYYSSGKSLKNDASDTFSNYLKLKKIADNYYQNGDWKIAKSYLIQSQSIKNKYYESMFTSKVRFVGPSITSSLGHMAISLNLRAKNNLLYPEFYQDYIVLTGESANDSYLNLWRSHFNLVKVSQFDKSIIDKAFWFFSESVETAPVRDKYLVLGDAHNNLTINWESTFNTPILELNDEIMSTGRDWISKYGVHEKDWFITLHVRDNKYDRQGYGRNARIDDYLPAIKEIINSGGYVVVIGDNLRAKYLPELEGLINYSGMKFRSSILDTYFLAENEFLISTTSGPMNVPITFGKRILATNAPDIGKFVYYPGSIVIPKLVTKNGIVLSFKEMLESKAGWSDSYIGPDFCWRDNSEDEIKEAVREMISNDNAYSTNKINNDKKFASIFCEYSEGPSTTISSYFLNKWHKLL